MSADEPMARDTGGGNPRREILLVYDGDCPLCNAYCRAARIRESVGTLRLVDARGASGIKNEMTRKGLDVDKGMALKVDEVLYYGSDAVCALSLMSSRSGVFNRLNYWMFSSRTRARWLYPVLRGCRNLLLKVLRRTKINNLGLADNERF
jgi:predicted DCC family thiol-disulfide oxidoreductase YuxK